MWEDTTQLNEFSKFHPIVNFTYFGFVILYSMIFMHPVCLFISLACAFTYSVLIKGKKAVKFGAIYMIPMMLMSALINPAFNHEGATILTYLSSGNPLTLESITYGIAAAVMLVSVMLWFSCYNAVMTSDKFIYLFGKIIPAMSLILSMVLRFVPRFKAELANISYAQKCIGRDVSNGTIMQRTKNAVRILSIMVTWALENAIETADSMKCRGYGLPGRTAFSIYSFDSRDKKAMAVIVFAAICVLAGAWAGKAGFRYYPTMKSFGNIWVRTTVFIAYFVLCATPIFIELREEAKWKQLRLEV